MTENLVVDATVTHILQPGKIDTIAKKCVEIQSKDTSQNNELNCLQKQLCETQKSINNLMATMEQGIISKTTKSRLAELGSAQEKLEF